MNGSTLVVDYEELEVLQTALLAMIKPAKSICLTVKSFLISLRVQVGYVMI